MPRFIRCLSPGAVHHIISRFVNRSFRLRDSSERAEYLRRLERALSLSDWQLIGYALMSSHVHLLALAGFDPPSRWLMPLHAGFAFWLNRRQGTLGPVFADRFKSIVRPPHDALRLLAYIHNNPVRAGIVTAAADSSWTSHQAYLGLSPMPPRLAVTRGLALCGLDSQPDPAAMFDLLVRQQAPQGRDPELTGAELNQRRRQVRQMCGAPVELGTGTTDQVPDGLVVLARPGTPLRPRWAGSPQQVLSLVCEELGMNPQDLLFRCQERAVVRARRLTLLVWSRYLGRAQVEMAAALGLSAQGASSLLCRRPSGFSELVQLAETLAHRCWEQAGPAQQAERT